MKKENKKEITVQEKKEVQSKSEPTLQGKAYIPATDIVDTGGELILYMDMPGVSREKLTVKIEKDVLKVDGEIDPTPYQNLEPLYTEYNIGHFTRKFELPNEIDQSAIKAGMSDGVLTLTLPKVPEKQPRLIEIQ